MKLFPAIDLYEGKAVRLFKGDYAQMTVYNSDPTAVAADFAASGAECIHIVDLEGAKSGTTPNFDTVCKIKATSGLFCEIGGGIRTMEVIDKYLGAGKMGAFFLDLLSFDHETAVYEKDPKRMRFTYNCQRLTTLEEIREKKLMQ